MAAPESIRHDLRARGYAPLPLIGKRPAMEKWQHKSDASSDEIRLWSQLYPYCTNTGILTRLTPAIDIDIFNPEAAEAIEQIARDQFEEHGFFLVRIGKAPKRAILFRTDAPFAKLALKLIAPDGNAEQKIEILGDGQQLAVDGIHPETQKAYAWHGGTPWTIPHHDLPYLCAESANAFLDAAARVLAGLGYRTHASANKSNAPDDGARANWPRLIASITTGAELHDSIRDLAASFVASGIPDGVAERILQSLMEASPSRGERWASRYEDISRAVASAKQKWGKEATKQTTALDWRKTSANARDIQAMKFNPISFLVPHLIPNEGVTLICAKPKVGKSWLVLDIAVAATANRYILGDLKPVQGAVLYLALEDSHRRLQGRMAKLLSENTAWPESLTLATQWRRVDQGGLDDIRDWVTETKAKGRNISFVAVDVLMKIRPPAKAGQPAYQSDYDAITGLHNLAIEAGIPIVVIHHTRKAEAEDLVDKVSGTAGLTGAADTIIVIEKQAQGIIFDVRGRDIEADTLAVQFNKETCRWTILGSAEGLHRTDERNRILSVFEKSTVPLSTKDVTDALACDTPPCHMSQVAVRQILSRMARNGDLERLNRGRYGIRVQNSAPYVAGATPGGGDFCTAKISPTGGESQGHKVTSEESL